VVREKVGHNNYVPSGWFAVKFTTDTKYDHCVSLCGYGTLAWLAEQFGATVPNGSDGAQQGYAMFTWGSIGIIDEPSLLAITKEAWLRNPTTKTTLVTPVNLAARFGSGGDPRVYYLAPAFPEAGQLGQVCELAWGGGAWNYTDVTTASGGYPAVPVAVPGSAVAAIGIGGPNVFYLSADGHVQQLWYGSSWNHNDLTAASGGVPAVPGSALTLGVGSNEAAPRVYYLGSDKHVHELAYGNGGWHDRDVTADSQSV
jgi:hypothetical protein